jgi:ABC-type branched-subunit amino acid transport system substrate-binding protein
MFRRHRSFAYGVVAAALLAALPLAACSSSSSSTSSLSTDSTSSGGSSAAGDAPYTVITWNSYSSQAAPFPESLSAANAAVQAINAAGGINGRKIKLITCDDGYDPNKTIACAQEAVQDKVSAVVGASTTLETSEVFQILQQAGIPYIGGDGISPPELQSTISFSEAGSAGQFYGLVAALKSAGDTKLAVVKCEVTNCDDVANYVVAAAKLDGVTLVRQVTAPIATTDYTAAAATAIRGGVDGVIFVGSPPQAVPLVKALHGQGFKGNFAAADVEFPPNYLSALGSDAHNVYVVYELCAPTDTSYPGVVKFLATMKKYAPSAALTAVSLQTWWGFQIFSAIAAKASGTSSAAILAEARSLPAGSINVGVGPSLPVAKTTPLTGFPGLAFDPEVAVSLITNGTPGPSKLTNPFTG